MAHAPVCRDGGRQRETNTTRATARYSYRTSAPSHDPTQSHTATCLSSAKNALRGVSEWPEFGEADHFDRLESRRRFARRGPANMYGLPT